VSNNGDSRLANRASAQGQNTMVRNGREQEERSFTENREMTDDERLESFQTMLFQQTLPTLPSMPGEHVCWLTTNNPRDSIAMRTQWGYRLIKASELPGYEHIAVKTGEYIGCVGVNEMVAAKIKVDLYQKYMKHAHHDAPNSEEAKINSMIEVIAAEAKRKGASVEVGEGTAELGKGPARPRFENV
jgi:hypothetical protein